MLKQTQMCLEINDFMLYLLNWFHFVNPLNSIILIYKFLYCHGDYKDRGIHNFINHLARGGGDIGQKLC